MSSESPKQKLKKKGFAESFKSKILNKAQTRMNMVTTGEYMS